MSTGSFPLETEGTVGTSSTGAKAVASGDAIDEIGEGYEEPLMDGLILMKGISNVSLSINQ